MIDRTTLLAMPRDVRLRPKPAEKPLGGCALCDDLIDKGHVMVRLPDMGPVAHHLRAHSNCARDHGWILR